MEQKIVFFDIDGTLYERRNPLGVPESTREAIRRLQEKGNLAFICTGRTRAEMEDWWSELGFDGMICGCGTYISYKGEVVHERKMDLETVEKIVEISEKHGAMPVVEGLDKVYFDDSTFRGTNSSLNELYANYLADFKEHAQPLRGVSWEKIQKVTVRFPDLSNLERKKLCAELCEFTEVINHGYAVECVPEGYNKASGIERLIQALGIDRKNTYAFGDSVNDKEMLTYVEYGIAMGNSVPEILELAKYSTDNLYDDGIYKACEKFGLI